MFQGSFQCVSRVIERSSKGNSGKFQGGSKKDFMVLQEVLRVFEESFKDVSRKIETCFNGVLSEVLGCFNGCLRKVSTVF